MPEKPVPGKSLDGLNSSIEEQMARAKASRVNAEAARHNINSEIMDATKRMYLTLVEEGEQTLEHAKKLDAEAELKTLEARRELQDAHDIRQKADSYLQEMIGQAKEQSQEILHQAQSIKAEAVAFREQVLVKVRQQAAQELELAQSSRVEADTYRQKVIAQTQQHVEDTINSARLTAEQEGREIKQSYAIEANKVLAQAEMIKAAAEEQMEAQRLYAEAANLQSESMGVLNQARVKANRVSPLIDLMQNHLLSGEVERLPSEDRFQFERLIELERRASWIEDSVDPAPPWPGDINQDAQTESPDMAEQIPETPPADLAISDLLLANELILGLVSNQRSRAYPIKTIAQEKLINDSLGELEILVAFGPPSELGIIFNRVLDGQSLIFEPMPTPHNGVAQMQDQQTGTIWEALTGLAVSGPLAGKQLELLSSEYSFWFAWSKVHPETEVY